MSNFSASFTIPLKISSTNFSNFSASPMIFSTMFFFMKHSSLRTNLWKISQRISYVYLMHQALKNCSNIKILIPITETSKQEYTAFGSNLNISFLMTKIGTPSLIYKTPSLFSISFSIYTLRKLFRAQKNLFKLFHQSSKCNSPPSL